MGVSLNKDPEMRERDFMEDILPICIDAVWKAQISAPQERGKHET